MRSILASALTVAITEKGGMSPDAMAKRMDMMMLDREGMKPPATK